MMIPMMKAIDLGDAAVLLAKYATDPNQEPVILTVKGKPVAVVLPAQGGDVETISLGLNPQFNALMERSRRSYYTKGGISSEEMRRRLGLKPFVERKPKAKGQKPKVAGRKRNGEKDARQV
jgi:antitoxin (DNA-binding transcriptional repressor) of toxin-antitoxin stability system